MSKRGPTELDLGRSSASLVGLFVSGRIKASCSDVLEALRGRVSARRRFMLRLHLGHIVALDQAIAAIEKEARRSHLAVHVKRSRSMMPSQ